jgi:hypothetical protein
MRKQSLFMIVMSFAVVAVFLTGCAGTQKASESSFKTPEVTLSQAEVSSYFGYWFYDNKVQPTNPAGAKPGNNGAPLIYSFVFNVKNPNDFPVLMDNLKFTVALEGFDLNTVGTQDQIWIPGGKTSQVRVPCVLGMFEAFMSIGVVGGTDLQKMGKKPWEMLEKWWTKAPDFSFPMEVREGSAVFKADGITKVAAFKAKYP